jgi:hypothetical protein
VNACRNAFFSPSFQLGAGVTAVLGGAVWTVLAILLTTEPPNVIAMSGVALIYSGYSMIQNGVTLHAVNQAPPPPA